MLIPQELQLSQHLYNPHSLLISKTNCAHMDSSAQLTLFKNAYIELS